jgi:hypothetical protein
MVSSTFQPRFGEDTYPIGRFILARARTLGITRTDLVHRLGYREIGTGHRKLSTMLLTGVVPVHIVNRLAEALEVDEVLVRAVFDATSQQKRDEAGVRRIENEEAYRTSLRPHLQVQTERQVPSPIFVAALLTVARLRIVHLPDGALTANDEARDRIVKTIIIDHWRESGRRVPAFGGITGYVLVLVAGYSGVDFGLPFSITGERSGAMRKVERLGEATLGIKRDDTRLTGLLKNHRVIRVNGQN